MQDYVDKLLFAINNYDSSDIHSVNALRDLVCWISDNEELKKDKVVAELLYTASQKMRVFGYNALNHFSEPPIPETGEINSLRNVAITSIYRSKADEKNILDKTQQEVVDYFQSLPQRRLLVSAPTSYGKTFLMREIVFLNQERYNNILLVFPTVALLLENARSMERFIKDHNLPYKIVKNVEAVDIENTKNIFVFTPERALQLIATIPSLKIDFFFFDEVYKIDEDYCDSEDEEDAEEEQTAQKAKQINEQQNFLNEDRGKTFRIALYLLSKTVNEYYLAGPNLSQDRFGDGMRRYLKLNHIQVKEINFEPTLRIAVNAYNSKIEENVPDGLMAPDEMGMVPVNSKVNDKIKDVVTYINGRQYGKTLLYCKSPGKAAEYSIQLSERSESDVFDSYPEGFKEFIAHIQKEYDVNHSIDEWSLIKVLKKGFGIHHGKLPKYIQQEILEQFNKGTFDVLFCTSTIVEGVNTDAQNMIILNASKGRNKLTPFDIKNIKGRAGRYYHCFIGRVFYMTRELERIEMSESFSLDFVTYSDKELGVIDLDNADIQDLTQCNQSRKTSRSHEIDKFIVPREVFIKSRMVSWENQNSLALTLQKDEEFDKYIRWISYPVDVDNFLHYNWIAKILNTFHMAKLIDENTKKRYAAIAHDYHTGGFKEILKYEIGEYRKGKRKTIDDAYARAFNARKDILEHKIPKMLSLFESIIVFVAQSHGISMDGFSLSRVRRYYETGVKTPLGEALMEYGFPVDAIRNLEDKFDQLRNLDLTESKTFCRQHYKEIISVFDSYEIDLFIRAMNSI